MRNELSEDTTSGLDIEGKEQTSTSRSFRERAFHIEWQL